MSKLMNVPEVNVLFQRTIPKKAAGLLSWAFSPGLKQWLPGVLLTSQNLTSEGTRPVFVSSQENSDREATECGNQRDCFD